MQAKVLFLLANVQLTTVSVEPWVQVRGLDLAGLGGNVLIKTPEIHFCDPFNPFQLSIDGSMKFMLKRAIYEKTTSFA